MNRLEELSMALREGKEINPVDRDYIAKALLAISQAAFEKSAGMFITGLSTPDEVDGMPELVFIAPTFGVDWSLPYRKVTTNVS